MADEINKAGIGAQRHYGLAHHVHAQHQDTKAQNNLA